MFIRILSICLFTFSYLIAQPRMNVVDGLRFDFGKIYVGTSVKRVLTIENQGTDTLVISDISSSCGCTGTLLSNDRIAPGKSGALEITLDTRGITGATTKAVTFKTNDLNHKDVRIVFSATVERIVELNPEYLFYGNIRLDSVGIKELNIKNVSKEDMRILSVKSEPNFLSVKSANKVIKPNETYTMLIEFRPEKAGVIKGDLIINTDNPNIPTLNLRYYGYGRGVDVESTKRTH